MTVLSFLYKRSVFRGRCFIFQIHVIFLCLSGTVLSQEPGQKVDSLKTKDGVEMKNCLIKRVDPDGLYLSYSGGIGKVKYSDMDSESRSQFQFDEEKARKFSIVDAKNAASSQLEATLRAQVLTGRITGRFDVRYPKGLSPALTEVFNATHSAGASGKAVTISNRTSMVRRENAVGGVGLATSRTEQVKEEKYLGNFVLVGRDTMLRQISKGRDLTIFPAAGSREFFGLSAPVYLFTAEAASQVSSKLVAITKNRKISFYEKKILGSGVGEVKNHFDPFMRKVMVVQNGRLVDVDSASSRDASALVGLSKEPFPILTIAMTRGEICDTVLYRAFDDSSPLDRDKMISLFEGSTGEKFEEILPGGELKLVDQNGLEIEGDWIRKAGASQVYWSESGQNLLLMIEYPGRPGELMAVWGTSRLGAILAEVKSENPPDLYWSQVNGALSEFPPAIYEAAFSEDTGINDL